MKNEWIVNYILGETTPAENKQIAAWIKEDPAHEAQYLELKKIWGLTEQKVAYKPVDIDEAWSRFVDLRGAQSAVNVAEALDVAMPIRRMSRMRVFLVAASVLLVCGLSFMALHIGFTTDAQLLSGATVQQLDLPDGSRVSLNKGSDLRYHKAWLGRERQVTLNEGEAFFEVKHDAAHPFVIQSGRQTITVLGTSFNVRKGDKQTEVIVATGKVAVQYGDQKVFLTANQHVTIADTTRKVVQPDTVPDQLYRYYIHQEFIFENTPLPRVFEVLSRAYAQKFVLNPMHKKLLYTARFEQQNLKEIMEVILKTFNLKIEKRGDTYYIN